MFVAASASGTVDGVDRVTNQSQDDVFLLQFGPGRPGCTRDGIDFAVGGFGGGGGACTGKGGAGGGLKG